MKKLLALFLILSLIVPAVSFSDDFDPIVGCWYLCVDIRFMPEFASTLGDYDLMIGIYDFQADGSVKCVELDAKDSNGTPVYGPIGKWINNGGSYNYSILSLGEGGAFLNDGALFIELQNDSTEFYMKLRRLECFNMYADYVY